ncbi:MAG: hypothetical protein ABSF50_15230 [Burkholderiaceae bacterium]|jgi:hypothetical protein
MIAKSTRFTPFYALPAALVATVLLAGCVQPNSPPVQVQASNPSVTYKYRGDQELLQANQTAVTYCSQYRATPRVSGISDSPDGTRNVVFECVAMAGMPVVQAANPNLTYSYHTDRELLDASRTAQSYCVSHGASQAIANTTVNPDGSRTVTFQCTSQ